MERVAWSLLILGDLDPLTRTPPSPASRHPHRMSEEPDFSDPGWGQVSLLGAETEVNVRDESPLHSFALHVRGSDRGAADAFVARLSERLNVSAFDPEGAQESGIFGNG